jgi:L-cysteine:1D-myo-inositol 2-amino-2-deoxy-alpha-D-glucopyranoside ligase
MWIGHFNTQMKSLNVLPPNHYVLASSAVEKIISINMDLIKKGHAYEKNGNVYFSVSSFSKYGSLSRFSPEQMLIISQERGNNPQDPNKVNPLDFVLWVQSDSEPFWESPWGRGRPGWHIECTAMIHEYLGEQIDIHGGGRDLIFPHHESEIAQSEGYTGKKPYVNFWMHNGMVMYEGEKMSKSLGNLVLVEDMLRKYRPNSLRWYLLSHHYRQPWEFIEDELESVDDKISKLEGRLTSPDAGTWEEIETLLDDDFDTPEALRYLCDHTAGSTAKKALDLLGFTFQQ